MRKKKEEGKKEEDEVSGTESQGVWAGWGVALGAALGATLGDLLRRFQPHIRSGTGCDRCPPLPAPFQADEGGRRRRRRRMRVNAKDEGEERWKRRRTRSGRRRCPLRNQTSLCHDCARRAQQFVRRVTLQNRTSLEL